MAQDNYGDQHPLTNRFAMKPGGIGIPDGEGNFSRSALNLIELGEFGSEVETTRTVDGRDHSTGKEVAQDVQGAFYANDEITMRLVMALHVAMKQGAKGHKLPFTIDVQNLDGSVARSFMVREVMVKSWRHAALSKEPGEAAKVYVTFSMFGINPLNA